MAELDMLADIQRTVYSEEVTRQLCVMAQARESSPVIDRRSNHCATPPIVTVTVWTARQSFYDCTDKINQLCEQVNYVCNYYVNNKRSNQ